MLAGERARLRFLERGRDTFAIKTSGCSNSELEKLTCRGSTLTETLYSGFDVVGPAGAEAGCFVRVGLNLGSLESRRLRLALR